MTTPVLGRTLRAETQRRPDGRKIPNLRLEHDTGKQDEFQVRCEIGIPDDLVKQIEDDLHQNTAESLDRLRKTVVGKIDSGASPIFREIVELAFDDYKRNRQQAQSRGRKIPNLRRVSDTGKESEFQIQCEVLITEPDIADQLDVHLRKKSPDSLKTAKGLVTARIDPDATETFRSLVELAFDDNIGHSKESKQTQ